MTQVSSNAHEPTGGDIKDRREAGRRDGREEKPQVTSFDLADSLWTMESILVTLVLSTLDLLHTNQMIKFHGWLLVN